MDVLVLALTGFSNTNTFITGTFVKYRADSMAHTIHRTEGTLRNKIVGHLNTADAIVVVVTTSEVCGAAQRTGCAKGKESDNWSDRA